MAEIEKEDRPTEGGFTEQGIKIRHGLFGVGDALRKILCSCLIMSTET